MSIPHIIKLTALCFWVLAIVGPRAGAGEVLFEPDFSGDKISSPDWGAVFSHTDGAVVLGVEKANRPGIAKVAAFTLARSATDALRGKATYFRSKPISVPCKKFAVEWVENILENPHGPQFELWGSVGPKPNEYNGLLLNLGIGRDTVTFGKDAIAEIQPGWRHFKVVVSTTDYTFSFYYENMNTPVASNIPLLSQPEDWTRIGLGFALYVGADTPPAKWQIGGIKLLTND